MAAVDKFQRDVEELPLDATATAVPTTVGVLNYSQGGYQSKDSYGQFNYRDSFVRNTLPFALAVPADITWMTHDVVVADGVEITVEDTGEMLTL
jgi:hypothetical protein